MLRKIKLISKFMASQPKKNTIAMHILPNISRSKDNQATKFGHQDITLKKITIEKSYTKYGVENIPRRFSII